MANAKLFPRLAAPVRGGHPPGECERGGRLTLFVVPVVYTLLDDFVELFRRRISASGPVIHDAEPVAAD